MFVDLNSGVEHNENPSKVASVKRYASVKIIRPSKNIRPSKVCVHQKSASVKKSDSVNNVTMTRLRHVMKVSLLVICNNGVAKGLEERFKFAVGNADSAENVCVPPQMVNSNGTGVITSLQLVIISVRHNWVNHSSCMRPELCVCPQNFVYASRFSNIVKRVVKSLVYRQQQFRL